MEALKATGSVIGRTLKRYLLAGLATVLPIFVTIYLFVFVAQVADRLVGRYINDALDYAFGFRVPGLGVVIILGIILVAGYFSRLYIGQKLLPMLDRLMGRIPVISEIYLPAKQFSNLIFTSKGRKHFRRVVLVPYPSTRSFALGFVTNEGMRHLNERSGQNLVGVLVPFGPTPFTGVLLYYPTAEVIDLDIPVEAAIKTIVSAGVISPSAASGDVGKPGELPPPDGDATDGPSSEAKAPPPSGPRVAGT